MSAQSEMGESEHQASLRPVVEAIDREVERLRTGTAIDTRVSINELLASWAQLVELLAIGPAPEMRECPVCKHRGMRAATRCGFCWASLSVLPPRAGDH